MSFPDVESTKRSCIYMSIKRASITALLMLGTYFYISVMSHGEPIPPKKPFATFPKTLGDFTGTQEYFDPEVYDILGVDDSVLISYRNPEGKNIHLYVGYYRTQREGELIHSPKHCMPGAGWNIIRTTRETMPHPADPTKDVGMIKLLLKKGAAQQVVLYWFQSRGRFIDSEYRQKIYLVYDAILKNRTDGSFVRLVAPVRHGDEDRATNDLKAFARNLIPVLEEYLPDA